ncbi:MAG: VWA domain-containing protein, partial [Desulfocucumaceae bacterium]
GLSSAVRDIESFIFSENLERITPYFKQRNNFTQSMTEMINSSRQWGKSTNLYESLKTFNKLHRELLSSETIVFIVSDTRTVAPEGSARLLAELGHRCRDLIWLNTLSARDWEGQPQVLLFKSVVDMYECNTIAQLEKAMRRHILNRI